jgi:uncharacterized cupredoxin-like copper-binding protein
MNRHSKLCLAAIISAGLVACGGSDSPDAAPVTSEPAAAAPAADAGAAGMPDWYHIDEEAMTVELHIAAQMDGGWKFNGMANGEGTITVPVGYEITVEFTNDDSAMAHSLGVDAKVGGYGAMFDDPQPAFTGAITADPASMIEATLPGETESFTFTADTAGEYAMVCYIPGHAVTGMWIRFNVSDGEPGVSM